MALLASSRSCLYNWIIRLNVTWFHNHFRLFSDFSVFCCRSPTKITIHDESTVLFSLVEYNHDVLWPLRVLLFCCKTCLAWTVGVFGHYKVLRAVKICVHINSSWGGGVISVMTQSVSDERTNVLARFHFRKNCSLIPIIRLTSFSDWWWSLHRARRDTTSKHQSTMDDNKCVACDTHTHVALCVIVLPLTHDLRSLWIYDIGFKGAAFLFTDCVNSTYGTV